MNERLKALAKQALKHPDNDNDGLTVFDDDELKKFVEFIVRECAGIANKQFEAATGLNDRDCLTAHQMKKHFGVEE